MDRVLDLGRMVRWLRACLRWRGLSLVGLTIVDAYEAALVGLHMGETPGLDTYFGALLRRLGLVRKPGRRDEPFSMKTERHGRRKSFSAGCVGAENLEQFVRGWRRMGLIAPPASEAKS